MGIHAPLLQELFVNLPAGGESRFSTNRTFDSLLLITVQLGIMDVKVVRPELGHDDFLSFRFLGKGTQAALPIPAGEHTLIVTATLRPLKAKLVLMQRNY